MNKHAPKVIGRVTTNAAPAEPPDFKADLCCPACQTDLEIHQPDLAMPDRLLGICPDCHAWILVSVAKDNRITLSFLLEPG